MMASLMLATTLQTLDTTIAAVAIPHMQGSFSATQEQVAWVLTSYIVSSAIMTPMAGYLSDRLGRKRLYLLTVAGFMVTSMMCGLAVSIEEMVVFRILQGAFGAPLIPLAQSTVLDSYPPEKYGSGMALFGMGVMLGPILGPTLGAWLTEFYDWRWVFFVNLPLGMLALVGIQYSIEDHAYQEKGRPLDFAGFAYLSLSIGAAQLLFDRGNALGWLRSTEIQIEALVAVLCFYMFVVQMFTTARPFINPAIFKDRNFSASLLLSFVTGFNMMATMALLPPFLQKLLGYPVLATGWVLAPRGVGTMLSMAVVGRLVGRMDSRYLILAGILISAYSLWEMSLFDRNVSLSALMWTGMIQGVGMGLMFVPLSSIAFSTLEARYRTDASGVFNLARNIGSSVGISILMGMLAVYIRTNRERLVVHINPFNRLLDEYGIATYADPTSPQGLEILNRIVDQEAIMSGYVQDFQMMLWITLVAIPLLLLLRPVKYSRTLSTSSDSETG
jgi:DHA2 family multidrug resistance protein